MHSSPRSRLIVVTGMPGTGKSTLARQLAARLAVSLLTKDLVKECLFETLGSGDAAHSRRLSNASFDVLLAVYAALAPRRHALILEGNFRRAEHSEPLRQLIDRQQIATLQVLCSCDENVRRARLEARAADPCRHSGHRDALTSGQTSARIDAEFLDLPGERLAYDATRADGLIERIERWSAGAT